MTDLPVVPDEPAQRASLPTAIEAAAVVPATGPPQIFKNITPELSNEELTIPAVGKLLLDRMRIAEAKCVEYERYVEAFHAADKQVGILKEKLKVNVAVEIMFGVGLTMGGAAIALVPVFWDTNRLVSGIFIGLAVVLSVGAILARAYSGISK